MTYTAEDFERPISPTAGSSDFRMILVALRIAANVMRPGLIEAAVTQRLNDESSPTDDDLSAAIRAVLLGDAGT